MEPRHLKALVAVVQEGGFRNASRVLGISQPSLSQQIARLEDQLGVTVFDRRPDGVELTKAGELLYERAQTILGLLTDTSEQVRARSLEKRASISVSAIPTMAPFLLPRSVQMLRREHAEIHIEICELTTDALFHALATGQTDVGVAASLPEQGLDGFVIEHLGNEPLHIAMASNSKWAGLPYLCADDLQEAGVISLGELHCLGDQVSEFCATQDVDRLIRIDSGQIATLIELVRCDVGVSLLPSTLLAGHDLSGLNIRVVKDNPPSRPVYLLRNRHRPQSAVSRELSGFIKDAYASCGAVVPTEANMKEPGRAG
ncbi:MAG: LysR family transcriptional regulator [Planctomycetota bacterium]